MWASIFDFMANALILLSFRVFLAALALAVGGTIVLLVW